MSSGRMRVRILPGGGKQVLMRQGVRPGTEA
jgi:hypothetical protein